MVNSTRRTRDTSPGPPSVQLHPPGAPDAPARSPRDIVVWDPRVVGETCRHLAVGGRAIDVEPRDSGSTPSFRTDWNVELDC